MHVEQLRQYCLSLPHATESFPFDEHTLVFKVGNEVRSKIFAIIPLEKEPQINLKCDPDRSEDLRAEWEEIQPGWHMNKTHWNTVLCTGRLDRELIEDLVRHSYELIVESLPKKVRKSLRGE